MTKTIRTPTDSEILQKTINSITGNTQAPKKEKIQITQRQQQTPLTNKTKQKQKVPSYLENQQPITFEELDIMSLFC